MENNKGYAINAVVDTQDIANDTLNTLDIPADTIKQNNDTIIEDIVDTTNDKDPILESKVEYNAKDSLHFDIANQKAFLYGEAEIRYEDIHLKANYIEIDFNKNELFAKGLPDTAGVIQGKPVFREKGQDYRTKELRYNFDTEKGRTTNVITEEADGFLHGNVVKIMDDETVHICNGKYTTCDKEDPHFHIGFRKAKVMKDKIVSGPAVFYLQNIPTPIVVPFGFFPNTTEQSSGIIIPSYGESSNRGFYLRDGGFYWGISDYIDMSFKGDIYSRGSWGIKAESRYNKRYKYRGNFNINYAVNIDGEEGLPGYSRRTDFRVRWSHNEDSRARPNSQFRANVNAGSSQYNRYDPSTTEDYLSNTYQSNISYSATSRDGRYNFSANMRHSQNTITEEIELKLPEVAFNISRFQPFKRNGERTKTRWYEDINMSYSMNARNQISTTDSLFFESETWQDMSKSGIQHRIPVSHSLNLLNHFNLTSSITYNERWYFHTIEKSWENEGIETTEEGDIIYTGEVIIDTIPGMKAARDFNFSMGVGTTIYGMGGFSRGPVSAIRHVITPDVGFSFRPDFSDPFWGYYKDYSNPNYENPRSYSIFEQGIYGGPPTGKSGSINFSLSNNLEIKTRPRNEDDKEKKISLIDRLSLSASYNLAADSLNLSDINLRARTRLFDQVDVNFRSNWTPYIVDENNNKINTFVWEETDNFLQLTSTSWSLSFNYSLSGGKRNGENGNNQNNDSAFEQNNLESSPEQIENQEYMTEGQIDYSVPWNLSFDYNFNYNRRVDQLTKDADRNINQTLSMRGDIRLTPKWRIGASSGYDFENNDITYTSVNIYRDLHCWEMRFNWVPFGFRKSYNLTIRVKSHVLKDLKYEKRRDYYDF